MGDHHSSNGRDRYPDARPDVVNAVYRGLYLSIARHSDYRKERRWRAGISAVAAAIGWAALPMASSNPWLSVLALIVTAAGTFAAMGPFWSMPSLYLSRQAAAGGIALISALAGLGPFSFSKLLATLNGYEAVLIINAVVVIAGAGVLLLLGLYPHFEGESNESRPNAPAMFRTKVAGEVK